MREGADTLFWRYVEDGLSPEERAELDRRLLADAEFRLAFLRESAMFDTLRSCPADSGNAAGTGVSIPVSPFSRFARLSPARRWAAAAALAAILSGVLLAGGIGLARYRQRDPEPGREQPAPPPPTPSAGIGAPPSTNAFDGAAAEASEGGRALPEAAATHPPSEPAAERAEPARADGARLFSENFDGDLSAWRIYTRRPAARMKFFLPSLPKGSGIVRAIGPEGGEVSALKLDRKAAGLSVLGAQLARRVDAAAVSICFDYAYATADAWATAPIPVCLGSEPGPGSRILFSSEVASAPAPEGGWVHVQIDSERSGSAGTPMMDTRWYFGGELRAHALIAASDLAVTLESTQGPVLFCNVVVIERGPASASGGAAAAPLPDAGP